jgi:hypothetical protein
VWGIIRCEVLNVPSNCVQTFLEYNNSNTWERRCWGGVWGAWVKVWPVTAGSTTLGGSSVTTTDGSGLARVNFGTTLAAPPRSVVAMNGDDGAVAGGSLSLYSKDTTGFNVRVYQAAGGYVTGAGIRIEWIAVP